MGVAVGIFVAIQGTFQPDKTKDDAAPTRVVSQGSPTVASIADSQQAPSLRRAAVESKDVNYKIWLLTKRDAKDSLAAYVLSLLRAVRRDPNLKLPDCNTIESTDSIQSYRCLVLSGKPASVSDVFDGVLEELASMSGQWTLSSGSTAQGKLALWQRTLQTGITAQCSMRFVQLDSSIPLECSVLDRREAMWQELEARAREAVFSSPSRLFGDSVLTGRLTAQVRSPAVALILGPFRIDSTVRLGTLGVDARIAAFGRANIQPHGEVITEILGSGPAKLNDFKRECGTTVDVYNKKLGPAAPWQAVWNGRELTHSWPTVNVTYARLVGSFVETRCEPAVKRLPRTGPPG